MEKERVCDNPCKYCFICSHCICSIRSCFLFGGIVKQLLCSLLFMQEQETLLERFKYTDMRHLLHLSNKQPIWSEGKLYSYKQNNTFALCVDKLFCVSMIVFIVIVSSIRQCCWQFWQQCCAQRWPFSTLHIFACLCDRSSLRSLFGM